jgi:pyruvate formate lyase activating enzyme
VIAVSEQGKPEQGRPVQGKPEQGKQGRREEGTRGLIFDIQKFSLHDGTGIRTLVFFKGCPLACAWCSNPEGQAYSAELAYARDRCIGTTECDRCLSACATGAIGQDGDGRVEIDRKLCDDCGECTRACPSKALEMSGERVSVEDVIRAVEEDGGFYVRSGGGVTLSGGEPLSQAAFVKQLLVTARRRGLDTAIETSGLSGWEALENVAPEVDQIFYDIKCIDPEKHRRATGVSNEVVLRNFRELRKRFPEKAVVVRTPVIPGFNDSAEEIRAIARFVESAGGASAYELLPYHRFGEPKYRKLGRTYPLDEAEPPSEERMTALREIAARLSPDLAAHVSPVS